MTTLEALARALAQQPDDKAALHAFVDLLKESEPAVAMATVQVLLAENARLAREAVMEGWKQAMAAANDHMHYLPEVFDAASPQNR